jgi:hypothetical protein
MSAYCCIKFDILIDINHDARNHESRINNEVGKGRIGKKEIKTEWKKKCCMEENDKED